MENRKLVIVTRSLHAGGAERVISILANNFQSNRRCEVVIVTIDNEEIKYTFDPEITIIPIGKCHRITLIDKYLRYVRLSRIFREQFNEMDSKGCAILSMPEDIAIYAAIPWLISFRNIRFVASERNDPYIMPPKKISRLLRVIIYKYVDKIVFQTFEARRYFGKELKSKSVILDNPIEAIKQFQVKDCAHRSDREVTPFRIVAAGRLDSQKNFLMLMKAAVILKGMDANISIQLFGEGKERLFLEEFVKDNAICDIVNIKGRVNDWHRELVSSDLFVLTSNYEGVPNVILEAMQYSVPVIATDTPSGGVRRLLNSNRGVLVPIGDYEALAMEILNLIKAPEQRRIYGDRGRIYFDELMKKDVCKDWFNVLFPQ